VAEYRDDPQRLSRLLSAALWYAFCAACLMGCVALLFSTQLALWLLGDVHYAPLIRVLAVAQLGIALVNYMLAVVNGFMDVRRLAFIQVAGSIIGMALMIRCCGSRSGCQCGGAVRTSAATCCACASIAR
jgi:PST family polysaccharide transporter